MSTPDAEALQARMNQMADELINFGEGVLILASVDHTPGERTDRTSLVYAYRGNRHTAVGLAEEFRHALRFPSEETEPE